MNQTLRDKSCLVPCTGLYADVVEVTAFTDTTDFMLQRANQALERLDENMKLGT